MLALYGYRELLWNLVCRDLKARYKVSVLGFFWSLLRPLLTLAVLAVVFGKLMPIERIGGGFAYDVSFAFFLFAAYMPWTFFAGGVSDGAQALVANAPLLRKVAFPRELLPLAAVAANLVNFLLAMAVLLPAVYLLSGAAPSPALLLLVPLLVIQTALTVGIASLASLANVFFRDVAHILEVLLMAWFYMTPIFYPLGMVTERIGRDSPLFALYVANPMTPLVEAWRETLLASAILPGATSGVDLLGWAYALAYPAGVALALLAATRLVYRRYGGRIADRV